MKLNILREAHEPMKGQHKNYFLFWFLIHNFSIFHEVAVIITFVLKVGDTSFIEEMPD
jgi:hypothetical protein